VNTQRWDDEVDMSFLQEEVQVQVGSGQAQTQESLILDKCTIHISGMSMMLGTIPHHH